MDNERGLIDILISTSMDLKGMARSFEIFSLTTKTVVAMVSLNFGEGQIMGSS